MKKKFAVLMTAIILITLTAGCKKNENVPVEVPTIPAKDTTAPIEESDGNVTVPTNDSLQEIYSSVGDMTEESRENAEPGLMETSTPTEDSKPIETIPSSTEPPNISEQTPSATDALPDNWETPDL